jgi:hypothetical protein
MIDRQPLEKIRQGIVDVCDSLRRILGLTKSRYEREKATVEDPEKSGEEVKAKPEETSEGGAPSKGTETEQKKQVKPKRNRRGQKKRRR